MAFEPPEIDTDLDAVTDRLLDGMGDRIDGWEPVEGALEVALAEELGREVAVMNQTFVDLAEYAVAGFGQTVFQFPAYLGEPASVPVTITVTVTGAVIPAGFTVVGVNSNGEEVAFQLPEERVSTSTTMTAVLVATDLGAYGNGIPASTMTVATVTTTVVSVAATAESAGGRDPEPINAYLDRLTDYLASLRPGGVNARDLAALARTVPGVHRAIAADLYNPAAPGTPTERTATVFCVDETGHAVASGVLDEVRGVLERSREVNFIIHVVNPNYTRVQIAYTAVAEQGADPAVVEAEIDAALGGWLTSWGSTVDDPQAWVETTKVRRLEAARVAGSVPGVAYLDTLTINGSSTADLDLAGPAALPTPLDAGTLPSTVTGTVS